jgi:hypothetical protein
MIEKFSYNEYKKIILKYKNIIKDFSKIKRSTKNFCLIRHDIEFSIDRAVKMAKIDNSLGIKSSFFIQVKSDCYNAISDESIKKIKQIIKLKHYIGIHFYVSNLKKKSLIIQKELKKQIKILELALGRKIDRVSIHRPPKWILSKENIIFKRYINTYSNFFFEFKKNPSEIKYYADSNHRWNYGHPLNDTKFKKFQILLHPDEWSEKGLSEKENLISLIKEEKLSFILSLDKEYKTFKKYFKKSKWKKI